MHYMVKLDNRLNKIRRLFVDRGRYFVINRGRQYGKTTTLRALAKELSEDYLVLSMDFQRLSSANFKNESAFAKAFARLLSASYHNAGKNSNQKLLIPFADIQAGCKEICLDELFILLIKMCAESSHPIVLIIDEIDSASDNQVFIDFLSLLRGYYLNRENCPSFHSVILASVYDIKNLKLKLSPDDEHPYNSPWNIAAKFNIDMNFSTKEISDMLSEYEKDHDTGMDTDQIAAEISRYTSGYPYLVSAICKILDEELPEYDRFAESRFVWNREGISTAAAVLLKDNTSLFDSMSKQISKFKNMRAMLEEIIYHGKQIPFSPMEKSVNLGIMFGFLKEENGYVAIANQIFEMALLNMFIAEEAIRSELYWYGQRDKNQFLIDGRLHMRLLLEKFVMHFTDLYGDNDETFIEKYGRKFFLLYLKPIINGTGNYYIEAQTRDARRTDVIVDYLGEQFVIELKIFAPGALSIKAYENGKCVGQVRIPPSAGGEERY